MMTRSRIFVWFLLFFVTAVESFVVTMPSPSTSTYMRTAMVVLGETKTTSMTEDLDVELRNPESQMWFDLVKRAKDLLRTDGAGDVFTKDMLQLALDAVQDAMFEEMDRLDNETLTPEETFATKLNLVQLEKNEMALFAALDEMEGKMAVPYIAPREQPSESSTNKFNLHP